MVENRRSPRSELVSSPSDGLAALPYRPGIDHVSHLEGSPMPDSNSDAHAVTVPIRQAGLSRRRMLVASGGVGLGALLFAGCSNSSLPKSTNSGAAGVPRRGGTIRVAI